MGNFESIESGRCASKDSVHNDKQRDKQHGDLYARSNCDSDGKIHLLPDRDRNRSRVFSYVANDRENDKSSEPSAKATAEWNIIDAVNYEIDTTRNDNSREDKDNSVYPETSLEARRPRLPLPARETSSELPGVC